MPRRRALLRDGGVIATGYDAALDELRCDRDRRGPACCSSWRSASGAAPGIAQLKVGYNRVHGYYIELPRSQSERAPLDYQRRQTVKNAERYITPELKQFEDKVLGSRDRALARERELFDGLLDALIAELAPLKRMAAALALADVLANLAERAVSLRYVRPELTERAGASHRRPAGTRWSSACSSDPFVPNDLDAG